MKKAFTLVELIFVIVILGILSVMSTELILNVYKNYVYSKAINELESKVEIALEQISSRLTDRIRHTTIARLPAGAVIPAGGRAFVAINETTPAHAILEWYGQSSESRFFATGLNANNIDNVVYGWSGFLHRFGACSYNAGTRQYGSCFNPSADGLSINQIRTPATNFTNAANVIRGYGSVSAAVVFPVNNSVNNYYDIPVGAPAIDTQSAIPIDLRSAGDTILFTAPYTIKTAAINSDLIDNHGISERYYVSHSAYALVPTSFANYNEGTNVRLEFDLALYYNYYPWNAANNTYLNGASSILLRHVTMFRFRGNNNTIELKLCARDPLNLPNSQDFIVCKSKVVL
jgi:HAD-superfamily hydrolase, subfamily IA, variant 1 family protein